MIQGYEKLSSNCTSSVILAQYNKYKHTAVSWSKSQSRSEAPLLCGHSEIEAILHKDVQRRKFEKGKDTDTRNKTYQSGATKDLFRQQVF